MFAQAGMPTSMITEADIVAYRRRTSCTVVHLRRKELRLVNDILFSPSNPPPSSFHERSGLSQARQKPDWNCVRDRIDPYEVS